MNPILMGSSFFGRVIGRLEFSTNYLVFPTNFYGFSTIQMVFPTNSLMFLTIRPDVYTILLQKDTYSSVTHQKTTAFFSRNSSLQLTRHGQGFRRHLRFLKATRLIYMYLQLFHLIQVLLKYSDLLYLTRDASVDFYL